MRPFWNEVESDVTATVSPEALVAMERQDNNVSEECNDDCNDEGQHTPVRGPGRFLRGSTTPTQGEVDQGETRIAFTLSGKTRGPSKDGTSLTGSPERITRV
jgi:hypothetical protein